MDNYQTIRRKQRFFMNSHACVNSRTHVCDQGGCMRPKSGVIIYSPLVLLTYKTLPRVCLQYMIVAFPDHTHLLFFCRKLNSTDRWLYGGKIECRVACVELRSSKLATREDIVSLCICTASSKMFNLMIRPMTPLS